MAQGAKSVFTLIKDNLILKKIIIILIILSNLQPHRTPTHHLRSATLQHFASTGLETTELLCNGGRQETHLLQHRDCLPQPCPIPNPFGLKNKSLLKPMQLARSQNADSWCLFTSCSRSAFVASTVGWSRTSHTVMCQEPAAAPLSLAAVQCSRRRPEECFAVRDGASAAYLLGPSVQRLE